MFTPYISNRIHSHPHFQQGGKYYNYDNNGFWRHIFGSLCKVCGCPFCSHPSGKTCITKDLKEYDYYTQTYKPDMKPLNFNIKLI